jgi:SMODS-associated NUDIX domain
MIEGIVGHFLAHLLDRLARDRLWRIRLLPCKLIAPNSDIRVSFSAFLRIADGDSYLLVRSLHRREAFGPLGGVYKHFNSACSNLDDFQFRPQRSGTGTDMINDLRGFIPRRQLLGFTRWFDEGSGREDSSTCLRRELMEELKEVRLAWARSLPQIIQFKQLRRIQEGPSRAAGQTFSQYRIFDFFDVIEPSESVTRFFGEIRSVALSHQNLLLATSREIIAGRASDGRLIGHHAGYLFGRRRVRPDEPMFVDSLASTDGGRDGVAGQPHHSERSHKPRGPQ